MQMIAPRHGLVAAALLAVLGLAACENKPMQNGMAMSDSTMPMKSTLYERLGGKPAIVAVVDDFVANVAADPRINGFFAHADIPHLKMELVDQICAGTGGPCTYTGKSMKAAHQGMGITSADFNALVEDLQKSLNKFKVAEKDQSDLLAVLGPMKTDIVEKM
jgi:hemoglobin